MEPSHYTSDLDPSAILGFGSALALLDTAPEAGRLLTGAFRSMGLADLQAVVFAGASGNDSEVVGSLGTRALPDAVVEELRRLPNALALSGTQAGRLACKQLEISSGAQPALAAEGVRRLTLVRLGTVGHDFGVAVAGQRSETPHTPMQRSCMQMMAAQVSMALHRIKLDRQRRTKEEALRESESRYRTLFESAPVAYVSVTGSGEIRMANPRAAELMGTATEDLRGRTLTSFCANTTEASRTTQRLTECIREGRELHDEGVQICRADGERIWASLSVQPIDPSQAGAECLVMMIDVSERVEMESALREARNELEDRVAARTEELEAANERLREKTERLATLRTIDQAILEAESPAEIATEALRHIEHILPFQRASVAVLDWEAEQVHMLATREESVLEPETTIPLRSFYLSESLRAGETEVLADLDAESVPDAAKKIRAMGIRSVLCLPMMVDEELIGIVHVGRAETDAFSSLDRTIGRELADHLAIALRQSRLLEAVREQHEQIETLHDIDQAILAAESPVEIASVAIDRAQTVLPFESASVTVTDWDTGVARVLATCENNVLESPATVSLDEVYLSENLRAGETEVISDEDYAPVPEAEERIREMGLKSILCLPMVVEGEVVGVVHAGRTEPDAFSAEDRRVGRKLADHLAIALRQGQLLEEVQEQRERLEERVQERTAELESFTYSVSHDLRTPLRAIDGYTRILREEHADRLDDEGRRLLDVVYESTQTMSDLIDDLLTLSRLGRREVSRVEIDMGALAEEAYDELKRSRPDETDAVQFILRSVPPAEGDRSMLRHVLTNLFSNAVKFTQNEESPCIEFDAKKRDGEHVYMVRDNGVGFDESYADKMFGVFNRLHGDEEFEGTGVGLALVERIVRRHGGTVGAEGTEGEGATLFFTLPSPQ